MPHRPSTFRYRVYNGLMLFSVLVIMGTSVLSLRATSELEQSVAKASHSQDVLEQANRIWGLLGNGESNGLRYIITGEEHFLLAYRVNLDEMNKAMTELSLLVADNPGQQANVARLSATQLERVKYGSTSMALKADANRGQAGAQRAAIDRVRSGRGLDLLTDMRQTIRKIVVEEKTLLERRNEQRNQMIQQNWATVLMANGLAMVAGLVGYSATRRMQRKAQQAFRSELQAEQARRSSQDKSVFLASMSHEIRTPMNAIFGFTNLLAETVTDPTQVEYVSSIKKSGQALLSLINDVLDLSKMEAGKLDLREEPTNLHEIVDQTLTMFRQAAEAKGIYLRAEYEGRAELPLLVDPVRLRQVLINLVGNAIKYTERGGVVVRICCVPSEIDGHCDLKVEVIDSGTGIAPHQLSLIFDPFEQGDNPDGKSREGTGLGLSIARRLATLMGGSLQAESTPGEGSRFYMHVPQRAIHLASISQQPTVDQRVDFNRLPALDVLVVDDVAWNRDLAQAYLRGSHHKLREAQDGVEALEEISRGLPDVVLMDLRMPRMSGEQAMLRIKTDADSARVPVIAVTASSMSHDEGTVRSRFDGFVRKPYSKADLFEALAAHFPVAPATPGDAPAPAAPAAGSADSGPGRRDPAATAQLRSLHGERLPKLRANLRMREAGALATELSAIAEALAWPALTAHAAALDQAVAAFDVPAVKRLIDTCPVPEESA
ncbi:ATP-binding protein [Arenimonas sp. MALMAid1274]|uniref:ATP-binding protein n=1 Tax=Arenimonas sp. MALMAid1274 TaxID=3411630 RepID=UPI003BA0F033